MSSTVSRAAEAAVLVCRGGAWDDKAAELRRTQQQPRRSSPATNRAGATAPRGRLSDDDARQRDGAARRPVNAQSPDHGGPYLNKLVVRRRRAPHLR